MKITKVMGNIHLIEMPSSSNTFAVMPDSNLLNRPQLNGLNGEFISFPTLKFVLVRFGFGKCDGSTIIVFAIKSIIMFRM